MKLSSRRPNFLVICSIWLLLSTLVSAFWVSRAIEIKRLAIQAENLQDANHLASRLRYARQETQGFLWALSRSSDMERLFTQPGLARFRHDDRPRSAAAMAAFPAVAALSARLERMAKDLDSGLLFVADRNGRSVASSDWRLPDPTLGSLFPDRAYLQQSLAGRVGEASLVGRHTKVLGYYFAVPIWSAGQVVGSLVLQHPADDWAARIGLGRSPVLVTDGEGVVLFSNRKEWGLSMLPGRVAPPPERCQALFSRPILPPVSLTAIGEGQLRDADGRIWMHTDVAVYYSSLRVHLLTSTERLQHHARSLWMKAAITILLGWVVLWLIERIWLRLATLKRLSWLDPLTQVLNRRGFDAQAAQEWTRARRFSRPLSLLAIDLDHFKAINDRFGHPAGDQVLRTTASLCKVQLRDMDLVARTGGEEFVVLLPETDIKQARVVAERIRQAVQNLTTTWEEEPVPTTVSIGLTMRVPEDTALAEVFHRADQALYRAKQMGRNRVEE